MTNQENVSTRTPPPNHVWVYGKDHSPWVQAVLLGLHDQGIAHTQVTVPPFSVFLTSGVLMPAAQIDDGPWLLDSGRMLVELGFSEVRPDERRALLIAFGSSAMRRFGRCAPDTLDFQLFGLVQMCASIPVPALAVIRKDPTLERLREWVETMQRRSSSYRHL